MNTPSKNEIEYHDDKVIKTFNPRSKPGIMTQDEAFAQELAVYQYFMNQRIKPVVPEKKEAYKKYVKEITLLHQILVYSMKSKQTTDIENVKKLGVLLSEFSKSYFSKK